MSEKENNQAVRRSHQIIKALAGHFYDGLSNKELAEAIGTSAVNITRDLQTLEDIGYARKLENGRWALSNGPMAVYTAYNEHYLRMQHRLLESHQNINAKAQRLLGEQE